MEDNIIGVTVSLAIAVVSIFPGSEILSTVIASVFKGVIYKCMKLF
jgi:hypothetical protein